MSLSSELRAIPSHKGMKNVATNVCSQVLLFPAALCPRLADFRGTLVLSLCPWPDTTALDYSGQQPISLMSKQSGVLSI